MATSWVGRSMGLAAIAYTGVEAQYQCTIPNHAQQCQADLGYRITDGNCLLIFSGQSCCDCETLMPGYCGGGGCNYSAASAAITQNCIGAGGNADTIGNGLCDPDNNNEACLYDQGDCCECNCGYWNPELCGSEGFNCIDPSSACVGETSLPAPTPGLVDPIPDPVATSEPTTTDAPVAVLTPSPVGEGTGEPRPTPVASASRPPDYPPTGSPAESEEPVTATLPPVDDREEPTPGPATDFSYSYSYEQWYDDDYDYDSPTDEPVTSPVPAPHPEAPTSSMPVMAPVTPGTAPVSPSPMAPTRPAPTASSPVAEAPTEAAMCSNGVRGVESDNGKVCCVAECGSCGGVGCSKFSPDLGANDCCVTEILDDGEACSVWGEAPCFLDGASPVPSPTEEAPTMPTAPMLTRPGTAPTTPGTAPVAPVVTGPASPTGSAPTSPSPAGIKACSNGIYGVESDNGDVCCVAECGACGGVGCSRFSPDLDADDCCVTEILLGGEACSFTGVAPCFYDDGPPPGPAPTMMPTPGPEDEFSFSYFYSYSYEPWYDDDVEGDLAPPLSWQFNGTEFTITETAEWPVVISYEIPDSEGEVAELYFGTAKSDRQLFEWAQNSIASSTMTTMK
eukprot:g20995.t1